MIKMPSETWNLSPKHNYSASAPGDDLYDNLPYQRNYDNCNGSHVAMESGNVYKFYSCKESKKSYSIPNQDDIFMELIAKQQNADPSTEDSENIDS